MKAKILFLLICLFPAGAATLWTQAAAEWRLSSAKDSLIISGTGAMSNYGSYVNVPWYNDRSTIKTVIVEDGVTTIGKPAFAGCTALSKVVIGSSVNSIGDFAFNKCSTLSNVTIPNNVKSIGTSAFEGCSALVSVTMSDQVNVIGKSAFYGCEKLETITLPAGIKSIADKTFEGCAALASITAVPDSVQTIGMCAFKECSALFEFVIPDSVTTIADEAFMGCIGLRSLTVGSSVDSIGERAFASCHSLGSITNLNLVPQKIADNVFASIDVPRILLYVLKASFNDYDQADVWGRFILQSIGSTGIDTPVVGGGISVYPNLVSDNFRIAGITNRTQVTVTDLSGQTVLQQTVDGDDSVFAGHLPQGIYLVHVNGSTNKIIRRNR